MTLPLDISALREALCWCLPSATVSPRELPESLLRSPELHDAAGSILWSSGPDAPLDPIQTFRAFQHCRNTLARARHCAAPTLDEVNAELRRPRALLVTALGHSLGDGLVPIESRYFFDERHHSFDELPPWDTWVNIIPQDRCPWILSWVPKWAGVLVHNAMRIDYLKYFSWVTVHGDNARLRGWGQPWRRFG